ncbi:MAG: 3-deoxy-manno-octulosonate cytidylyltransferase [Bacteroidota bacterium]
MNAVGIIPSRYGSTRFPGKPLALIGGKPMIQRVYEQCLKSNLSKVVVATDDQRIAQCVESFGGDFVMTSSEIQNGTERCRAALSNLKENFDLVVNVQGDEPFIDPEQINSVIDLLINTDGEIATLISPALNWEEVENPNRVKAVKTIDGKALYFSRSAIPHLRNEKADTPKDHFIHLGIYGFTSEALRKTEHLTESNLEKAESLEQLRWLENGMSIYTAVTDQRADSVDTKEDLLVIEKRYFL